VDNSVACLKHATAKDLTIYSRW